MDKKFDKYDHLFNEEETFPKSTRKVWRFNVHYPPTLFKNSLPITKQKKTIPSFKAATPVVPQQTKVPSSERKTVNINNKISKGSPWKQPKISPFNQSPIPKINTSPQKKHSQAFNFEAPISFHLKKIERNPILKDTRPTPQPTPSYKAPTPIVPQKAIVPSNERKRVNVDNKISKGSPWKQPKTSPFNQSPIPKINTSSQKKHSTPFNFEAPISFQLKKIERTSILRNTRPTPPPIEQEMRVMDNQSSANSYGKGQPHHVRDTPYSPTPIPSTGKNLIPRSDEVDEILSYVPNWMIRWGNTLIFLILAGILVMSYYIKYPDVVKGVISINSTYPPVPLVTKRQGMVQFFKVENEFVEEGETIGYIKNDADYEDVQALKTELSNFQKKLDAGWKFSYYELPSGLKLGDLQSPFSSFYIKLKEKQLQATSNKNNKARKQNIEKKLQELKNIKRVKVKSIAIKKEEHDKAKKILDTRYKVLYKHGSISAAELNIKESEVNNLLAIYQQDLMGLNEIEKQIIDLNSSTNELDFQKANEDVLSESTMIAAFENLKNNIQGWEAAYVLTAPITGKLSFVQFVKDNRYLKMEQEVAQIIPENNANETFDIIGELLIPSLGSGKVAIGQIVNIELKDYPKKQYGIIEGKVESIGAVNIKIPNSQGVYAYQVSVVLPDGLKNSRNKQMKFRHNMQGNAEIITADIRLIERFFHEARELVDAK